MWGLPAFSGNAGLAPHLNPEKLAGWIKDLEGPFRGKNLEAFEESYQKFVQAQTYRDLQSVYDPANRAKLQIAYATFVPHGGSPGHDLGYGFHVVKRLELTLPNGAVKVIDVNEQWPESGITHGLLFPDEIRIKTRVRDGERDVPGSERDFLFDSIRLAWDDQNGFEIARQTRYRWDGEKNKMRQLRVPVSAPISCLGCHHTSTIKTLSQPYLGAGETMSSEAVVQRSFFKKPLAEQHGYRDYVAHLEAIGMEAEFIAKVKRDLEDPHTAFAVPGIVEKLEQEMAAFSFGQGDQPLEANAFYDKDSQGAYQKKGQWFLDFIEEIHEGKYRWWNPTTVVPRSQK